MTRCLGATCTCLRAPCAFGPLIPHSWFGKCAPNARHAAPAAQKVAMASRRPTRPPWRLKQPMHVHITAPRRLGRSVAVRAGWSRRCDAHRRKGGMLRTVQMTAKARRTRLAGCLGAVGPANMCCIAKFHNASNRSHVRPVACVVTCGQRNRVFAHGSCCIGRGPCPGRPAT